MAIYKQSASKFWWVSIYRKGQPRLRISTGTENKSEAEEIERALKLAHRGDVARDRLVRAIDEALGTGEKSGVLLETAFDTYCNLPDVDIAPRTVKDRRQAFNRFLSYCKENWPKAEYLLDVSRDVTHGYYDTLRKTVKGKTWNTQRGHLSTIFEALKYRAKLTENPWAVVPTAKTKDSTSGRAFTVAEEMRLRKAARGKGDWHAATIVARYTGLRLGDIRALDRADIDGGNIVLDPSKTERHNISVTIPLHKRINALLRHCPSEGALFPSLRAEGKSGRKRGMYAAIMKEAGVKANGAKLTFHCWRHTFRTRLAEAGVLPDTVKKLGGWTQDATADLYNHDVTQLRNAIDKL